MTRTLRYAVLALAVASMGACAASSVTEPTATPKCTTSQQNTQSCVSADYINPVV